VPRLHLLQRLLKKFESNAPFECHAVVSDLSQASTETSKAIAQLNVAAESGRIDARAMDAVVAI
jgi:hypothetical protein